MLRCVSIELADRRTDRWITAKIYAQMRTPRVSETTVLSAAILIRSMVGGVFLSEGIQKFLFPDVWGVGRFVALGIPLPHFSAWFVAAVEIICGSMLILGFWTRVAAIPLFIDLLAALATTKITMLQSAGFWATMHEARIDYCMFLGLLFLLIVGGGYLSVK